MRSSVKAVAPVVRSSGVNVNGPTATTTTSATSTTSSSSSSSISGKPPTQQQQQQLQPAKAVLAQQLRQQPHNSQQPPRRLEPPQKPHEQPKQSVAPGLLRSASDNILRPPPKLQGSLRHSIDASQWKSYTTETVEHLSKNQRLPRKGKNSAFKSLYSLAVDPPPAREPLKEEKEPEQRQVARTGQLLEVPTTSHTASRPSSDSLTDSPSPSVNSRPVSSDLDNDDQEQYRSIRLQNLPTPLRDHGSISKLSSQLKCIQKVTSVTSADDSTAVTPPKAPRRSMEAELPLPVADLSQAKFRENLRDDTRTAADSKLRTPPVVPGRSAAPAAPQKQTRAQESKVAVANDPKRVEARPNGTMKAAAAGPESFDGGKKSSPNAKSSGCCSLM